MKEYGSMNRRCLPKFVQMISTIVAMTTSVFVIIFWIVFSTLEHDIKHHMINWYFMMHFKLTEELDMFNYLRTGQLSMIMLYLSLSLIKYLFGISCDQAMGSHDHAIYNISYWYITIYKFLLYFTIFINTGLIWSLLTVGHKLFTLFQIGLPLLSTTIISNQWFITIPILFLTIVFLFYFVRYRHQTVSLFFRSYICRLSAFCFIVYIIIFFGLIWLSRIACTSCNSHKLSNRPVLTAHRGCFMDSPENSIVAFDTASKLELVKTIETDIQVSSDGELFLLHDRHLARTTNIVKACPSISPLTNASDLEYHTGVCPIGQLSLKADHTQTVPTFKELLQIVLKNDLNVVFDLNEPPIGHKYHTKYIDITLKTIIESGIDMKKVWWLLPVNRSIVHSQYPGLTLSAKTSFTSLDEFQKLGIQIANEEYTTHPEIIRTLHGLEISVNMYTVNSVTMYEYAWCLGVQSVTTDNCHAFNKKQFKNHLYEYCHSEVSHYNWSVVLIFLIACISFVIILYCKLK